MKTEKVFAERINIKNKSRCEVCGIDIPRVPSKNQKHITCSAECKSILLKRLNYDLVKCDNCGELLYKRKKRKSKTNFCNDKCMREYQSVKMAEEEIIELHNQGLYDYQIAEIAECSRASITFILNRLGFKGRRSKINDIELRNRIRNTNKGTRTGSDNHKWKGNSTYKELARGLFHSISREYMIDKNYKCELCDKRGGNLNVHHIKEFYIIIEEFLKKHPNITIDDFSKQIIDYDDFIDKNNLLLVCEECHKKIHYSKDNSVPSLNNEEGATTIESIN